MPDDIIYTPPVGEEVRNPNVATVVEDVLKRDESFWSHGECFGTIVRGTGSSHDPRLTIVYHPGYGYYLEMALPKGAQQEYLNPAVGDDYSDVAKVWVGQSYLRIPRAFFLSPEQAAKAVETFCQAGRPDPAIRWVSERDVSWEFFDPDDQ